jgi:hypothetical protein
VDYSVAQTAILINPIERSFPPDTEAQPQGGKIMKENLSPENTLQTTDMYEAGYYVCLGYSVLKVEVMKEEKKVIGKFTFSGEGLTQAQIDYFNGQAVVNLLKFRRSYIHLNSIMGAARRDARIEGKEVRLPELGGRP